MELRIRAVVDKGADAAAGLKRVKEDWDNHVVTSWDIEEIDMSEVRWQEYQPGDKGLSTTFISNIASQVWGDHHWDYDIIIFFVSPQTWPSQSVVGWHLGKQYSNYEINQVKTQYGYQNITSHEVMHTVDDLMRDELGRSAAEILGVEDFDRDVVHGHADGYREYEYEEAIRVLGPHLFEALKKRRNRQKQITLMEQLMVLYKQLLRALLTKMGIKKPKSVV